MSEPDDWPRTLRSGSRRGMYTSWGFAGLWNLISLPMAVFVIPQELAAGNHLAIIGLAFPAVGVWTIVHAIKRSREWRHYGVTELTLDPYPGSLGGHVGGSVFINAAALARPCAHDNVEVTLECVYSYMSGSGEDRSRRTSLKWQARGPGALSRAGSTMEVQFRFDVPANLPASERQEGDAYHYWRVHLWSKQPVSLDRTFEIGVFPGTRHSDRLTTDTTALGRTAAAEELNSAITDFASAQKLRGKYGMSIEQRGDRLRLLLHSGRQRGMALGMFVVGGAFAGVGWFVPPDDFAAMMIKWGFGLFGWTMVGASSYIPFNELEVRVGPDEISRVRSWFGVIIRRQRVRPSDLRELEIVKGASTRSGDHTTIYYRLIGKGDFGDFRLLESVSDKQLVEAVRDRVMHCAGLRRN